MARTNFWQQHLVSLLNPSVKAQHNCTILPIGLPVSASYTFMDNRQVTARAGDDLVARARLVLGLKEKPGSTPSKLEKVALLVAAQLGMILLSAVGIEKNAGPIVTAQRRQEIRWLCGNAAGAVHSAEMVLVWREHLVTSQIQGLEKGMLIMNNTATLCRWQLDTMVAQEAAEAILCRGGQPTQRALPPVTRMHGADFKTFSQALSGPMPGPVILTGMDVEGSLPRDFTRRIREECGHLEATLKRAASKGAANNTIAGLEDIPQKWKLAQFLDAMEAHTLAEPLYLWDWSIAQQCPSLLKDFKVPRYIAGDVLHSVLPHWPSLLAGSRSSRSALHIDDYASHFWMILVQGVKRWRVYPLEAVPFLYPNKFFDTIPITGFDDATQMSSFPLFQYARAWDFELQAGEMLVVPYDMPHMVWNEQDAIAVAGNMVDVSNFDAMSAMVKAHQAQGEGYKRMVANINANKLKKPAGEVIPGPVAWPELHAPGMGDLWRMHMH